MNTLPQSSDPEDEVEYVGAPTEFAGADEVPEWVANVAKVLFFIPTAFVTVATIPLIFGGLFFTLCMCLMACGALFGAL